MSTVTAATWDTHAHVIGDPLRFPLSLTRGYDPPAAPLAAYLALLDRHGLARGVLVQPSVYAFDNRCLLDALDRADGRLLGVAVPAPDTLPEQFEALHRVGIRGVRCNLLNPGGLALETVIGWQPILRDLGWHVSLHIAVDTIEDLRALVERFAVPVVIDHMGRPAPGRLDPFTPRVSRLIELVRAGACFVRLSAPYRLSTTPPPWRDVTPLARSLLAANPARCLWATDWPHTDTQPAVAEECVFDALLEWCPAAHTREAILARTPSVLLG